MSKFNVKYLRISVNFQIKFRIHSQGKCVSVQTEKKLTATCDLGPQHSEGSPLALSALSPNFVYHRLLSSDSK
jgi:hypothetical protein